MNINIPVVLTNSSNKVIITSSNHPNNNNNNNNNINNNNNKPTANLRLIQNSNSISSTSSSSSSIISNSNNNKDHDFFRKYSKEIFIKFRSADCEKRIDILQFNNDGSLEQNLNTKEMFVQRDRSQRIRASQGPVFGAGTEFCKEAREDAWHRKFALNKRKIESKDPINLSIGRGRSAKKYKAVRESMFENSQYCVFIRSSSDSFEAVSVKDWYKMQPELNCRFTKPDDAVDEMNKLDKKSETTCTTFFKRYVGDVDESGGKTKRTRKYGDDEADSSTNNGSGLIVTSNDNDMLSDSSVEEERELVKKKKNAALVTKLRLGKERDYEESDVDDHQGDEVDYMTHSSSDEDNLPELEKEKIYTVNNVDEEVASKSDDEISNMDEENNVNNNPEEVEGKINKDNEVESNAESDSSNDSSPMSSIDESDYEDNNILKQKLSSTINKNVANQIKLNSHRTQSNSAITHFDDISRKFRQDNNTQNSRIIQEMFKYLTRKPISKSNLFKKLISKKLINIESQKLFESLFREMNTVTHIVNGEKLFSILN